MPDIEYSITVTPDHGLVVNDTPVPYPSHIDDGDSEGALSWALDSVADQHNSNEGSTMSLRIEDQREGGYGVKSITSLPPGQNVDLEALRERAGFVWAPPPPPAVVEATPAVDEPSLPPRSQATWVEEVFSEEPIPEATPAPAPAPAPASASRPVPSAPAKDTSTPLKRDRPEPEVDDDDENGPGISRRTKILVALAVIVVLALAVLARMFSGGGESYAAVCLDDRTMVRQQTLTPCEEDTDPYYTWWYVPEGEYVPPVGGFALTGKGNTRAPANEDATITYGFADDGGVFSDGS